MSKYILIAKIKRDGSKLNLYEIKTDKLITEKVAYATKVRAHSRGMIIAKGSTETGNKVYWRRISWDDVPDDYASSEHVSSKQVSKNKVVTIRNIPPVTETSNDDIRNTLDKAKSLKPKTLIIDDLNWKLALRGALRGENILILGYSGCGKTFTATSIAEGLSRPFFKFNMGAMQDARASLIGNTHFSNDTGTFFADSDFIKAIKTPGAVVLLDEYTRITPDAENIMLTVLDKEQRYIRIDEDQETPLVKVAPGVCFIATANVGPEFTSTRMLDRATKDRFSTVVELPLLSSKDELKLAKTLYPDINRNYIKAIVDVAVYTRTNVADENTATLATIISTRSVHAQLDLARDNFYYTEIMEGIVVNMFDSEGGVDSNRAEIRSKIQEHSILDNESPILFDDNKLKSNDEMPPTVVGKLFDEEKDVI